MFHLSILQLAGKGCGGYVNPHVPKDQTFDPSITGQEFHFLCVTVFYNTEICLIEEGILSYTEGF